MRTAFLYAGQGSQHPGMGREFYETSPEFREIFDKADLPFDIREICFQDDGSRLNQTRYTQPCMVAFAAGVTCLLKKMGIRPVCAAGLSLGEYSALHCAGAWDAQTVIELAAFRGRAMTEAAAGISSAMAAVMNLDHAALQECCLEASTEGVVEIANENCPGQLVIAGEKTAVEKASELARAQGARRVVPLNVSGPFHTSLMAPAGEALRKELEKKPAGLLEIPVLFNCLGDMAPQTESITELLVRQVQSGVLMEKIIRSMKRMGVDAIVEIGPGKVLSGFVRRTAPEIKTYAVETPEELDQAVCVLKG